MKEKEKFLDLKIFWSPAIGKESFQEKVRAVSSKNKMGWFDVLPQHINFITLILDSISIYTLKGEKITYQFKRGVLEVSENKINVFLGL